ncbi:hypothetical protein PROFUN_13096 [Planoprotostelium fungivorum]|uniref:EamA domain-containing protein n=1 Tax=Planoprotostelium fungivorum TaxID=1890364 RepID=A0A2P6N5B3_9EUKA|nr:hypothetical protein PROFUN_13096 [Planoprotostelium fungivorum]
MSESRTKQIVKNIVVVFGIIICWVASAELVRLIQTEDNYEKPYFLTWILLILNMVCFPSYLALFRFSAAFRREFGPNHPGAEITKVAIREFIEQSMVDTDGRPISRRRLFLTQTILTLLWFGNMYFYYRALSLVDVSVVISVWNSSCVFVYLLSIYLLNDTFSFAKLASVLLCLGGVILIATSHLIPWSVMVRDRPASSDLESQDLVLGSILSLLSGLSYAMFIVYSKKVMGSGPSEVLSCSITYSMQAVIALFFFSPGIPLLDLFQIEPFSLPNSASVALIFVAIQIISFFMNLFFVFGNAITNPLFVSLASMVTIPVGALTDYILHDSSFSEWQILGTIAIVIGFLILSWPRKEGEKSGFVNLSPDRDDKEEPHVVRLTHSCQNILTFPSNRETEKSLERLAHENHPQNLMSHSVLVLCLTLVSIAMSCQIYVDSQSGVDGSDCGSSSRPCQRIPLNSTSVCLSSGQYDLEARIPSQLQWWRKEGIETKPEISVSGNVSISCDVASVLMWADVNIIGMYGIRNVSITHSVLWIVDLIRLSMNEGTIDPTPTSSTHLSIDDNTVLHTLSVTLSDPKDRTTLDISNNIARYISLSYALTFFHLTMRGNEVNRMDFSGQASETEDGLNVAHLSGNNIVYHTIECEAYVASTYLNNDIYSMEYKRAVGQMNLTQNRLSSLVITDASGLTLKAHSNEWKNQFASQVALSVQGVLFPLIHVYNCTFEGYTDETISFDITLSTVVFDSLSVRDNEGGGGIMMKLISGNEVNITSCELSNNLGVRGGAIYIYGGIGNTIHLSNCTFIDNVSPYGSAIYIGGIVTNIWMENVFVKVFGGSPITSDDSAVVVPKKSLQTLLQKNVTLICPNGTHLYSPQDDEHVDFVLGCVSCGRMQYLIGRGEIADGHKKGTECTLCTSDLDCTQDLPQALPGWWCGVDTDGEIGCKLCPNGYCNHLTHPWNDSCIGQRSGVLCGGCREDHTLSFLTSECLPLSSCKTEWISLLAIIPIIYVSILLILPIGDGSIWKSASYYVQTLPLINQHNDVISIISSTFNASPGNKSSSSLGLCIGQLDYIHRELLSLYIPLSTVAILAIGCMCITVYKRRRDKKRGQYITIHERETEEGTTEEEKRSIQSRFTTAAITAFLLVYSGIISICLRLLFCVEIQGEWVMYNSGVTRCKGPTRYVMMAVAAVVFVLCPLIILYIRYRVKNTTDKTGRDVLMVIDGCYRDDRKYWEAVFMLRRFLVAAAYVLITNRQWSIITMLSLFLVSLVVHLRFTPFVKNVGQDLETVCLMSLCGVVILSIAEDHGIARVLSQMRPGFSSSSTHDDQIIMYIPIAFSVALVIHKIWKQSLNKRSKFIAKMRNCC